MFLSPIFGGCKYTNNFLFINKKPEIQHLGLLITSFYLPIFETNPTSTTSQTMDTDRKWVLVRIDGKIASISTDYRQLAAISASLVQKNNEKSKGRSSDKGQPQKLYEEITATTVDFDEVWRLRKEADWEDLILFGTDFQKKVWRKLWELTHPSFKGELICYSDFAELCSNRAGVRAVAHAIGLNPISVVIPCHLVIPKESIDKIMDIKKKAETTIFKGDDLCINSILSDESIDFGNYSLGRRLKRELILKELG